MEESNLIDEAFYVKETSWKTWDSYDKDGNNIITSLTKENCINATRQYLKWKQEGFPETPSYSGKVDGKL